MDAPEIPADLITLEHARAAALEELLSYSDGISAQRGRVPRSRAGHRAAELADGAALLTEIGAFGAGGWAHYEPRAGDPLGCVSEGVGCGPPEGASARNSAEGGGRGPAALPSRRHEPTDVRGSVFGWWLRGTLGSVALSGEEMIDASVPVPVSGLLLQGISSAQRLNQALDRLGWPRRRPEAAIRSVTAAR
ncbi:hypothetical protein [Kitasatospora sp. MAP5-34]|uniref:hypothetical protein n=1 Tax=Kitasatospora sp. MAP5-34 TaxID=3035102 RepID=UPI002475F576|nr:hypothetical protein [Kitasatospora sp. MAP5-34]